MSPSAQSMAGAAENITEDLFLESEFQTGGSHCTLPRRAATHREHSRRFYQEIGRWRDRQGSPRSHDQVGIAQDIDSGAILSLSWGHTVTALLGTGADRRLGSFLSIGDS